MKAEFSLKALIVDDEMHARENLKMLLEEFCPQVDVVGMADSVEEARKEIHNKKPQVVFLDIRMPSGAEGFELLDTIEEHHFQVVFVTAFKDYAIRAFNANAIHYILKPIDIEDLKFAVEKLQEYYQTFSENDQHFDSYLQSIRNLTENLLKDTRPKRITLYHSKGFKVVEDSEIVRLVADGNCTRLVFANGSKYLDTKTMRVYEDILDPEKFVRVHKSHIINLDYLKEYSSKEGNFVYLKDGSEVPVSRGRLSYFLTQVKKL